MYDTPTSHRIYGAVIAVFIRKSRKKRPAKAGLIKKIERFN